MTHIEFVDGLRKVPFERGVYTKLGLDENFIYANEARYNITRKKMHESSNSGDPIKDLLEQYEVTNMEIGMVHFNQVLSFRGMYVLFGKVEVDDLGINEVTKEILVLEEGTQHILWYCAANSQAFLAALLEIAHFMEKQSVDESLFENEDAQILIADECADIAGGSKYVDFYRMLLGV